MSPAFRLLATLRDQRVRIAFVALLSLAIVVLQCFSAWLSAVYLWTLLQGPLPATLPASALARIFEEGTHQLLDGRSPYANLVAGAIALAVVFLLTAALRLVKLFHLETILQETNRRLRLAMFEHSLHLDMNFFRLHRPGEVAALYGPDLEQTRYFLIDVLDRSFMQPVRLALAGVLLYSLSPRWSLIGLGLLSSVSLVLYLVGRYLDHRAGELVDRRSRLQGFLTEHLSTALLSHASADRGERTGEFRRLCHDLFRANRAFSLTHTGAGELVSLVPSLALVCLLVLSGRAALVDHTLSALDAIKLLLLFPLAAEAVTSLAGLYVSLRVSNPPLRRIYRLLDLPRELADAPGAEPAPAFSQKFEFRRVDYALQGTGILHGIDLSLRAGRIHLLQGRSGCGKTTLLHLLGGLARPTGGELLVDGRPLAQLQRATWIRQIGFVFQDPVLLNQSVRYNLAWSGSYADDMLWAALAEVGLREKVEALPRGLDSPCGNRGELFSGGERQRLVIARALLGRPAVLVLDEPTSMLDELSREGFVQLVRAIARNRTLVLASHDPSLAELADVVVCMEHGRIVSIDEKTLTHVR